MRNRFSHHRRLSALLVVLSGMFAAGLFEEYATFPNIAPATSSPFSVANQGRTTVPNPGNLSAHSTPPVEQFDEIAARPLFSKTRRPNPVDEEPAPKPKKKPLPPSDIKFSVIGVVISADNHIALIQKNRSKEMMLVAEGEQVDGWLAEQIMSTSVVFRKGTIKKDVEIQNFLPASARSPKPHRKR